MHDSVFSKCFQDLSGPFAPLTDEEESAVSLALQDTNRYDFSLCTIHCKMTRHAMVTKMIFSTNQIWITQA